MKHHSEAWTPFSWHCPHCGNLTQAHMSANGTMKTKCASCCTVLVRRKIGRRHIRLDVYAPKKEHEESAYE